MAASGIAGAVLSNPLSATRRRSTISSITGMVHPPQDGHALGGAGHGKSASSSVQFTASSIAFPPAAADAATAGGLSEGVTVSKYPPPPPAGGSVLQSYAPLGRAAPPLPLSAAEEREVESDTDDDGFDE